MPGVRAVARANRAFLSRTVRYMCQAGVRQFLDIGSGLPSQGNVHEVAEAATGGTARTVYADHDPVAVLHGPAMLAKSTTALYFLGDARDPGPILDGAGQWLDFDLPVGVLMVALLHNGDADDAATYAIVDRLRAPLVPGSHLVLSRGHRRGFGGRRCQGARRLWAADIGTRQAWLVGGVGVQRP